MTFESRNPATGELLGVYREHDKAETDARLQRAWDGWRHWSRTPLHERIAFLTRLAELLEERAETYGRLITEVTSAPSTVPSDSGPPRWLHESLSAWNASPTRKR